MTWNLNWCIRGLVVLNWAVGLVSGTYSVYFRKPIALGTVVTIGIPSFILADETPLNPGPSAFYHFGISSKIPCAAMALKVGAQDGFCYSFALLGDSTDVDSTVFYKVLPSLTPSLTGIENTYASPHWGSLSKELAIDGRIDPYPASAMYHSNDNIPEPWWMVDLLDMRRIYQVSVLPRQEAADRFREVEISVGTTLKTDGDLSSYALLTFYQGPYTVEEGWLYFSSFEGIIGRYVSLQVKAQVANPLLQILEVNVKSEPL